MGTRTRWCNHCGVFYDEGWGGSGFTEAEAREWWEHDPRARLLRKLSDARGEARRLHAAIEEHRTATVYAPRESLNVNPARPWDERLWSTLDVRGGWGTR